jgi:hypothetical protein
LLNIPTQEDDTERPASNEDSFVAEQRKLSGAGTPIPCEDRRARALTLQVNDRIEVVRRTDDYFRTARIWLWQSKQLLLADSHSS